MFQLFPFLHPLLKKGPSFQPTLGDRETPVAEEKGYGWLEKGRVPERLDEETSVKPFLAKNA